MDMDCEGWSVLAGLVSEGSCLTMAWMRAASVCGALRVLVVVVVWVVVFVDAADTAARPRGRYWRLLATGAGSSERLGMAWIVDSVLCVCREKKKKKKTIYIVSSNSLLKALKKVVSVWLRSAGGINISV
jgi:hypothetical protein